MMNSIGGIKRGCTSTRLLVAGLLIASTMETPVCAEENAVIRNLAFTRDSGADVAAEARVVAVDGQPVAEDSMETRLPAGMRAIEVNCAASVFAGMGRVRLEYKSVLTSQLEAGRTYQLQADVSAQGECTPALK